MPGPLQATILALTGAILWLTPPAPALADSTEIRLTRGAGITVSAVPGGPMAVFGLAGRIWKLNLADGKATQFSTAEEVARRPALSPDGQWVAYETRLDGFDQIMVRHVDGEPARQVTFGAFDHHGPMWSPPMSAMGTPKGSAWESRRLTMTSTRGGIPGAWEVDVDTLELRKLTPGTTEERDAAWNRDGTRLAYVAPTERGTALFAIRPGGKPEKLLEERGQIRAPAWRPGGGLITYVRDMDGERQLRMLLLARPYVTKPISGGEDAVPYPVVWLDRMNFLYTADGQIRRREFGKRNAEPVPFEARIMVEQHDWVQREPDLKPTGIRSVAGQNGISYAQDGRYFVATLGDLWEIGGDNVLLRQLTNDAYVDAMPALSPDEKTLAFVSDRGGSLQIWRMDLESKRMRRLTRVDGVALAPRWVDGGAAIEYATGAHAATPMLTTGRIAVRDAAAAPDDVTDMRESNAAPDIPLTWQAFVPGGRRIIRAGRIFDGLGPGYLTAHEIVIDGDRIVAVRPWSEDTDESVRIIDARERTVIPGLIDMSVRQPQLGGERLGRRYLAYGITTVREAVGHAPEAVERRESWMSGKRIGPRLLLAGGPCRATSGGIDAALGFDAVAIKVCDTAYGGDRLVAIEAIHAAGVSAQATEPLDDILLGADETRLPSSYLTGNEHFASVAGQLGTTVTSNLAPIGLPLLVQDGELTGGWQYRQLFTSAERDWYQPGWKLRETDRRRRRNALRARTDVLLTAVGGGARLVTGSDAPLVPSGLGLHAELRLLTDAGLQPFQVLRMATRDAARALGAGDQLGVIRAGAVADLVIVDGDPLQDIRDALKVRVTVVGGRPFTRRELSTPALRSHSVGKLYN